MTAINFSAVLLAGGESRRMGQDKATIRSRDRPLWEHQLDLLRKLEPEMLLVSARIDPPWRPASVEFVPDAHPSLGPLGGIGAALARITSDHLLVLAVDMPFVTPGYLRGLFQHAGSGRGVVPIIENRAEPLAAIYPREACIDFADALSGTDFSLQPLVAKLTADGKLQPIQVSGDDKALFRNLNEPADLVIG